jgi:glycerol-3-phosphate dehydrogenase
LRAGGWNTSGEGGADGRLRTKVDRLTGSSLPIREHGRDSRKSSLSRLVTDTFDVLVIGGGVTGCGVALDAASRGLSVALVEKRDFAAGTSSRSSKLIHGGLRYLKGLDIGLVREALHERRLLVEKIAPHLVHPTPFLLPLKHRGWDRLYLGSGLLLYDALAGMRPGMPRHRHLSRSACLRAAPSLRDDALAGGIRYHDAQVDDARFTLMLARTASSLGALCTPAIDVTAFLREGDRISGVHVRDLESGDEFDVRALVVINATGVWASSVESLAGVEAPIVVRPSKGVHIVVPKACINSACALIIPTEKSVLFVLPWGDHWIIGTTDTEWRYTLDHPAASRSDIQYLLDHVNAVLRDPLTFDDIAGAFVGLRPLLEGGANDTVTLSREHAARRSAPGLISIAGGKYTTYRLMARDAVDAAARELPFAVAGSSTVDIPLLGAAGLSGAQSRLSAHPGAAPLAPEQLQHLLSRYGTAATEVLDLLLEDPQLAHPLLGAEKYLAVEVRYAALHEAALHIDDVLTRRTHISFEVPDRGRLAADHVARLMAPILGWNRASIDREVEHYRARLVAERAAESMLDDAASDAARSAVSDLRLAAR